MKMKVIIIVAAVLTISAFADRDDTYLKLLMDYTELMMSGNKSFDPKYYAKLIATMDDQMLAASNAMWKGMSDYYVSNGTSTDHWGSCTDPVNCKQYMEKNATHMAYNDILIYQPCDYASNIAYYHVYT